MNEELYYQEAPPRLRAMLAIASIAALVCGTVAFIMRGFPLIFWLEVLLTGVAVLLVGYNILYAIGLSQPMLVLSRSSLIYRKAHIPWNLIVGITEIEASSGPCVGIALPERVLRAMPATSSSIPRPTTGFLLRRSLARYGAIPIPRARGMTVDDLRHRIADYRSLVLTAERTP